ncbi:MAG: DJ-1/PfpI/YhbO family deglycase/protease [Candidatus Omnitrophica bacterium]|nr:DJ-1/PfpI/YhbO family deglycase/protease [Candidatus Omnitrophota bacterium]MBD3269522.1 DJ-1/PfpI/YhbO family deglycase/protease [Candidatus Omnitrophota bacterium]
MAKVAVIIDDMFEDSEYTQPAEAFNKGGHQLVHIGLKEGAEVKGKKEGTSVKIEKSVSEANPRDYDALLIPGGYSPDHLRVDKDAVNFAKKFMEDNKPVFSICHGAQLLITAKALEGRKATGWKSIIQDIKYAGAEYLDKEVVEDGNLVTSRHPGDLPAFIEACLKKL